MKILLPLLLSMVFDTFAQVIIEEQFPQVQIEMGAPKMSGTQVTMLTPVPGKVIADSILQIDGIIKNSGSNAMVRLRLGLQEQLLSADQNGRFSTRLKLYQLGVDTLFVETNGIQKKLGFVYRPPLSSFTIVPVRNGVLFPGQRLQINAVAKYENGEMHTVNSAAIWRSNNQTVGQIDSEGQFNAMGAGETVVYASYQDTMVSTPIQVIAPDPPKPTRGLTNLVLRDPEVILRVSDHAEEDGDVISIFLNDHPIVEFCEIFRTPQDFALPLLVGHNQISIRADNEGRSSPNTCTIWVISRSGNYEEKFKADQHDQGQFFITLIP